MKKLIALLVAVTFAVTLASCACNGNGTTDAPSSKSDATDTSAAGTSPPMSGTTEISTEAPTSATTETAEAGVNFDDIRQAYDDGYFIRPLSSDEGDGITGLVLGFKFDSSISVDSGEMYEGFPIYVEAVEFTIFVLEFNTEAEADEYVSAGTDNSKNGVFVICVKEIKILTADESLVSDEIIDSFMTHLFEQFNGLFE